MINKRNKKDKQKETNTMIDHVCIFIAVIIEYCVFEQ